MPDPKNLDVKFPALPPGYPEFWEEPRINKATLQAHLADPGDHEKRARGAIRHFLRALPLPTK